MENRRRQLIRNKRIATGLMIGAAVLFVVARLQGGHGVWSYGTGAGVCALGLDRARASTSSIVGFRCACYPDD